MTDLDDPAALRAADPGGMLRAVTELPRHCREGYALGRAAPGLPSAEGVTSLTFCGMGGSGIAGDVIGAVLDDRLPVPATVVRRAALPAHCGPDSLVLVSSYSGDTAETLSAFDEAVSRRCRVLAITSGGALADRAAERGVACLAVPSGFAMPRAAFGYLSLAPLGALETMGLAPELGADVDGAAVALERALRSLGPEAPESVNPAKSLARRVGDRVPVIWGADGIAVVAAARWKAQLNENAKVPAFSSSLPELDHNEVVGWSEGRGRGFFLVVLRHGGEPPDVAARFPLSIEIARASGMDFEEIRAGDGPALARLLELVLHGDLVATYLALVRGVDPSPIEAIDRLKSALAGA
ncbi:MAG: bifunctional phosphoglucose/phosphomannose isomerase [Actinomycetota bacterium]